MSDVPALALTLPDSVGRLGAGAASSAEKTSLMMSLTSASSAAFFTAVDGFFFFFGRAGFAPAASALRRASASRAALTAGFSAPPFAGLSPREDLLGESVTESSGDRKSVV